MGFVQQRPDQPDLDRVGDGGGGGLLHPLLGHGDLLRHGRRIPGGCLQSIASFVVHHSLLGKMTDGSR